MRHLFEKNSNPSMNLLYNEVLLKDGEEIGLVDPIIPLERYKDSFHWSTSDPDVVTVTDGVITANGEGVAIVSAQAMFDPLFRSSLFCIVRVIPEESDGSTTQTISRQNFTGFTDQNVIPHVTISSSDNVDNTTTVTNISDEFEGKIHFYGEPIEVRTSNELDWMEVSFELSQDQLNEVDINELIIYLLNEETGEMVPQATRIDESSGIVTATLPNSNSNDMVSAQGFESSGMVNAQNWAGTHEQSRKIVVSNVQSQNTTVNVAFVIDSEYSNQDSLDIFKTNITNTLLGLMEKSNIRVVFLDSDGNREVGVTSFPRTDNEFAKHTLKTNISSYFNNITPGGQTPTQDQLLGSINDGMVSGSKSLEDYRAQGANHKEFALFYTRHRAQFTENESILTELGNTTGLVVGQTIAYYDGGKIAYNESTINPLVNFLMEGNNAHVTPEDTGERSWMLSQGGDNIKNDVIVLQKLLVTHGYLEMPDGSDFGTFGSLTKEAVEDYQRDNRLGVDGIVGKNTWMELNKWDTNDMLWDYEKAQPNRTTWTYRYTLQNRYYFNDKSSVKLTSPMTETKINVIDGIDITATANNCHHIALFIDGEWIKTEYNNTGNVKSINLEQHFNPLYIGEYSIQVKGRSVPNGNDTTLVESEIAIVEVPKHIRGNPNEFALKEGMVYDVNGKNAKMLTKSSDENCYAYALGLYTFHDDTEFEEGVDPAEIANKYLNSKGVLKDYSKKDREIYDLHGYIDGNIDQFTNSVIADGMALGWFIKVIDKDDPIPHGAYRIMSVFKDKKDKYGTVNYHFYREDRDGNWSSKAGSKGKMLNHGKEPENNSWYYRNYNTDIRYYYIIKIKN